MTENLAGRGEGLAGLVAKWRADAAKGKAKAAKLKLPTQDTKELTEYDTAMEHCASELETALEAAAPPSMPPRQVDILPEMTALAMAAALDRLPRYVFCHEDSDRFCKQTPNGGWWVREDVLAALATPSPQAPRKCSCDPETGRRDPDCKVCAQAQEQPAGSGAHVDILAELDHEKYTGPAGKIMRGSPRKVGEEALTQERAKMIAASLFRDCTAGWKRTRESVIEEIASTLLKVAARPSSR